MPASRSRVSQQRSSFAQWRRDSQCVIARTVRAIPRAAWQRRGGWKVAGARLARPGDMHMAAWRDGPSVTARRTTASGCRAPTAVRPRLDVRDVAPPDANPGAVSAASTPCPVPPTPTSIGTHARAAHDLGRALTNVTTVNTPRMISRPTKPTPIALMTRSRRVTKICSRMK